MKHSFFASNRPLVFAHRGGSALAPENTLAAFDHGLALGADGLELDVRLSRDGVVMVHHDPLLDRTTNLRGRVSEHTARELSHADAGWHFARGTEFPFRGRGCGVPMLREVLARYPGVRLIIELKQNSVALAEAVVAEIQSAGAADRVCIGSFDVGGLRVIRSLAPAIATSAARVEVIGALARVWCGRSLANTSHSGYQVPERSGWIRIVSPRFITGARRAGLGVQVWTVDAPEQARRLITWGVDALITDRPDLIVPICQHAARTASEPR